MGPKGSPEIMQLFNEYLHQLILLRDALMPFENWEEVPIMILEGIKRRDFDLSSRRGIASSQNCWSNKCHTKRLYASRKVS